MIALKYKLECIWSSIEGFFYRIYNFLDDIRLETYSFFQRGKRGYSTSDTWSFNYYLAKTIYGGLKELRTREMARPMGYSQKRWNLTLDKILYSFDVLIKRGNGELEILKYEKTKYKKELKDTEKWMKERGYKFLDRKQYRAFKKGLELFIKHFEDFWD